jgi:hypothetical protein
MNKRWILGFVAAVSAFSGGASVVRADAAAERMPSMECRFAETRGGGGGGSGGSAATCRAWVNMDRSSAFLKVRCSDGFKLRDENAHQFDRQDHDFVVGAHDDRVAVLRVHRETRDPEGRMRAILITSSDPYQGYLSDNDRYRGFCQMGPQMGLMSAE